MKRLLLLFTSLVVCLFSFSLRAQVFTVAHDTVWFTASASITAQTIHDNITVPGTSSVNINWKVIAHNFPSDWIGNAAGGSTEFCDNSGCYPNGWDTNGHTTSSLYTPGTGDFHMQISLYGATPDTASHYMTVMFTSLPTVAYETFIARYPVSVPNVNRVEDVELYPNPATTSINIVFDGSLNASTVSVYNIIGKMMANYSLSGNSANINLENFSSGIYFIRLQNAAGEVVLTRKFTKQ